VDVVVVAVAVIADGFHHRVVEVAAAEAEHREKDLRIFGFLLYHPLELSGAGDADVEVAVGAENDAVSAAFDEVVLGQLVGELNACTARGGASGLQAAEGGPDRVLLVAAGAGGHEAFGAG